MPKPASKKSPEKTLPRTAARAQTKPANGKVQQKNAGAAATKLSEKAVKPVQKFIKKMAEKLTPKATPPKKGTAQPNKAATAQPSAPAAPAARPDARKSARPGTSNLGSTQRAANQRAPGGRSSRSQMCRVIGCSQPATTLGYSRLCYIKYWKQIKAKQQVLEQGTLQRFIRELLDKYPEKIIHAIRADLATDEGYAAMIRDLDLYGGIDELEHVSSPNATGDDDEESSENDLEDIKKGIEKEDEFF